MGISTYSNCFGVPANDVWKILGDWVAMRAMGDISLMSPYIILRISLRDLLN